MTAPQDTQLSPRGAQAAAHPRQPAHPAQLPVPGHGAGPSARGLRDAVGAPGPGDVGAVDLVGRLEGIRARLAALAPLVRDEAARQVAAAVREVDALLEQLRPPAVPTAAPSAEHHPGDHPATRPTGTTPGVPAVSPVPAITGRHRPPALPCGPDYPVLPPRHDG